MSLTEVTVIKVLQRPMLKLPRWGVKVTVRCNGREWNRELLFHYKKDAEAVNEGYEFFD